MKKSEQALIIHLKLSDDELGSSSEQRQLMDLETKMRESIADPTLGNEVDGHEFGGGFCKFYLYGPNADELENKVKPLLKETTIRSGSFILKRYGAALDWKAKKEIIKLESSQ
ncbi:MAG: hypothetical protein SFV17_14560 [Candidatus Obscuribacter sp.]|nr:hypothetical protein [Candidatus Obscuribacter sp.]